MPNAEIPGRKLCWMLLLVTLVLMFGQFGYQFWTTDESGEAAMVQEMFRSDNWAVQTLSEHTLIGPTTLFYIAPLPFIQGLGSWLGETNAPRLVGVVWASGILLFTGLLAYRLLSSKSAAIWSVIALGTMEGFIVNTHWFRSDSALAFFSVFTFWACVEHYYSHQKWMLNVAGLGLAGCFMAKGIIGILVIFFGWLPLFLFAACRAVRDKDVPIFIWQHVLMLLFFVLPVEGLMREVMNPSDEGIWWREWLRHNPADVLRSTSNELAYCKKGSDRYYLWNIMKYTIPWFPLILYWGWETLKKRGWRYEKVFLLCWVLGGVFMLTLSSEKCTLTLFPLLPVFAIILGQVSLSWPVWITCYGQGWLYLMLMFCAAIILLPLLSLPLPLAIHIPAEVQHAASKLGWRYIPAIILFVMALELLLRRKEIHGAIHVTCSVVIISLLTFALLYPLINAVNG